MDYHLDLLSGDILSMATLIFDFDGVLANSSDVAFGIISEIAQRQRVESPSKEFLRQHSTQEVISYLQLAPWKVFYYLLWARWQMNQRRNEIQLHPWCNDFVRDSRKLTDKMYVISTNSKRFLIPILNSSGLISYFDGVIGGAGLLTKHKKIRNLLLEKKLDASKTFLIGDETRDIDAAHNAKIKSIAVGWGYQSLNLLNKHNPDHAVQSSAELIELLKKIRQAEN